MASPYDSYSSDESADDHLPLAESLLSKKKREIVAKSMDKFNHELDKWLDKTFSEPPKSRTKRARDDPDSSAEDGQATSSRGCHDPSKKKKRVKRAASAKERLLACPYCKCNPKKYKNVKTCMGPGWETVSRVKEHLYRSHALPKHTCNRCYEAFEDEAALKRHQRSATICDVKTEDPPDGFDEEKSKMLHIRSKTKLSEEEKWVDMYRVLFPDAKIPTPYYSDTENVTEEPEDSEGSVEVERLKQQLRSTIQPVVHNLIRQEVDKHFRTVADTMKAKAVEIFEEVQAKLVRTWRFGQEQAITLGNHGQRSRRSSSGRSPPTPPSIGQLDELPAILAHDMSFLEDIIGESGFNFEPFINDGAVLSCDVSTNTDFMAADSAYYTSSNTYRAHNSIVEPILHQ